MTPQIFFHPELISKLPLEVKKLFEVFNGEIRLVGGSVRDFLLEKPLHDFDFATPFFPEQISEILKQNHIKAVPTGVKFGTITAVIDGKNFEITTLRKDNETDGRHCVPQFVDDYFLDASRRDFTINALYLDAQGLLHDYFGGVEDLRNGKVRFIGAAEKRINEDFLRILRFFRFSCEYGKKLDIKGLAACVEQRKNLQKLSRERVRAEILKMLKSEKKSQLLEVLEVVHNKKIAAELFTQKLDVKALARLFEIEKDVSQSLQMAVLFLDKKTDLKNFAAEICATNHEKKYFAAQISAPQNLDLRQLKELRAFHEKDLVRDFYLFDLAKNHRDFSDAKQNLQFLQKFSLPNFPLSGQDLIDLGFSGKATGEALIAAKKFWALNDFQPHKTDLIQFLKNTK